MNPDLSETHHHHITEHPDVLTKGYTTTATHAQGADHHWICNPCFENLAERLATRVVPSKD